MDVACAQPLRLTRLPSLLVLPILVMLALIPTLLSWLKSEAIKKTHPCHTIVALCVWCTHVLSNVMLS